MNNPGRPLSTDEFRQLQREIMSFHRFGIGGRMIKYILPTFDTRNSTIFHIEFHGMFEPVKEGKVFDYRDNATSMYENIMAWLMSAKTSGT